MKLSDMRIGVRLGLGFGMVIVLMIAIAFVGISRLKSNNAITSQILGDRYAKVALSNDLRASVNSGARNLRNALLATNPADVKKFLDRITESSKATTEIVDQLDKSVQSGRDILKEMDSTRVDYTRARDQVLQLLNEGNKDLAIAFLFLEVIPRQDTYFAAIDKMVGYQAEQMENDGKDAADAGQSATAMMLTLSAIACILAVVAGMIITRSIVRPITEAVDLAEAVAQGDLTRHINADSRDETGRLLAALKRMNASLIRIVSEVRSGSDTIATASKQISSGNLDLSSRTEQQAGSLEETASSMEELTSTVKQNADNARQANGLVLSASDIANKGGTVVAQVVDTMGSINDSAKKIVDIISVIDGIAFQTNILALNAAVEAARAGEQGRGFAVVAAEVRSLAQRSATAAKEIKALIDDSVEKVDVGAKLVDQAGATMQEIVDSVKRVTGIMAEITAASQEQSSGIEQINQAITQMDQSTQQNAALVEEATAASRSLEVQASKLVEAVSVFKLSHSPSKAAGASVRSTPAKTDAVASGNKAHSAPAGISASPAPKRLAHTPATTNDGWEEF